MIYKQIEPLPSLATLIDCYWIIESDDSSPRVEKIIPDGYPEIILHYGDPYRIKIGLHWEDQAHALLAGQITDHFFLESTGRSGMVGIKLKPAAVTRLFGVSMDTLTNAVVYIKDFIPEYDYNRLNEIRVMANHDAIIDALNTLFSRMEVESSEQSELVEKAIDLIITSKGMMPIGDIQATIDVNERKLERLFQRYVGLSAKLYARIIRFSTIFQLKRDGRDSWADLVFEAGFYDQSHFIKNFKEFTGEDPSSYLFENQTMANFFLNRQR